MVLGIGLNIKLEVMATAAMSDRMYNYDDDGNFAPDFDMFLWDWVGDMDPSFLLSVFTTEQIEGWSDCNWSKAEYGELFKEQQRTIDPQERKKIIDRMQEIFYEESPYIVLIYAASSEAYNTGKWTGWVRSPAKTGAVWFTGTNRDTYLQLKPRVGEVDEGSNVGLVVAAVVVAGAVAFVVLRRRGRPTEE